jgi:UDP-3-O-[3-hydroxymyristoyl] N-acetylglucosamine deacetylase/3-hydroxyacyl-[acyl-carrier-protein] dehydratase
MPASTRRTLTTATRLAGTGLHTGATVSVHLAPADAGTGIVFRRTDVADAPPLRATVDQVSGTERRTTLGSGPHAIATVEHVLAAIAAHRIDDALIAVDGPELPAGDGSAAMYHDAIVGAGVREHDGEPTVLAPPTPLTMREGDSVYLVGPAHGLRLTVTIEWPHPLIGRQSGCFDIDASTFGTDLARARTFGFAAERDALAARGLARGATAANTLILTERGTDTELRWPDEFVRHKTVDLLGDLALCGARLQADIVAFRPSHSGNVALARALSRFTGAARATVRGIEDILGVLPHRYPMLLVDRIVEVQGRDRIVGIKNVTINEPFFQGHFPGHPVMPGVLIVEAMAQVGGMLLMGAVAHPEKKVVYFMSLDGVKFRRPVVPGDQIRFELEMLQFRGKRCSMRGLAYVDGQAVAEANMTAMIVDR